MIPLNGSRADRLVWSDVFDKEGSTRKTPVETAVGGGLAVALCRRPTLPKKETCHSHPVSPDADGVGTTCLRKVASGV